MAEHMDHVTTPPTMEIPTPPQTMEAPTRPTNSQIILDAVRAHYIAQRAVAVVNLNTGLTGTGHNADVVGQCCAHFETINHTDSVLETIKRVVE